MKRCIYTILLAIAAMDCMSFYRGMPLPRGFYINENIVPVGGIPIDMNGDFDRQGAQKLLRENLNEFPLLIRQGENGKLTAGKARLERVGVVPRFDDKHSASSRALYTLAADYKLAHLIGVKGSASFRHLIEYELRPANPQYRLDYVVRPEALFRRHLALRANNQSGFVLFSGWIFAPEMFYIHTMQLLTMLCKNTKLSIKETVLETTRDFNSSALSPEQFHPIYKLRVCIRCFFPAGIYPLNRGPWTDPAAAFGHGRPYAAVKGNICRPVLQHLHTGEWMQIQQPRFRQGAARMRGRHVRGGLGRPARVTGPPCRAGSAAGHARGKEIQAQPGVRQAPEQRGGALQLRTKALFEYEVIVVYINHGGTEVLMTRLVWYSRFAFELCFRSSGGDTVGR